jgi:hypothetical protein
MAKVLKGLLAAGVAMATFALGATAGAQQQQEEVSPYVQAVITQFQAIVPAMAERGYPNFELIGLNAINNGASETVNYAEQDAQDIVFVAVCDNDCSNIDLRVRSGNRAIGEDVLADDVPVVQAPAGLGRPLSVDVIMTTCTVNPCVYGVAVFRR